jgi:excisionase family DNA binding protein
MTRRRPIVANDAPGPAAGEDDLTRLVQVIARQAAREAIKAFLESLERPVGPSGPLSGSSIPHPPSAAGTTDAGCGSNERFFSVVQVADRLGLSEKSVRRMIANGELPARQMGRLLRIGERDLATYIASSRLRKGDVR